MYVASGQPSGKATASLICGIFFFIIPASIVAVILGHIALSEIRKSGGRLIGEGRAIAGLVLGYLGLAAIPLILIVAAIAIPNLMRARTTANEASAVGSLRRLHKAESAYATSYPQQGYTCAIDQLGGDRNSPTAEHAGLIDDRLASGAKSGYNFHIVGCAGGQTNASGYQVIAFPIGRGTTGQRTFCTDQSGIIKWAMTGESAEGCLESGTPLE